MFQNMFFCLQENRKNWCQNFYRDFGMFYHYYYSFSSYSFMFTTFNPCSKASKLKLKLTLELDMKLNFQIFRFSDFQIFRFSDFQIFRFSKPSEQGLRPSAYGRWPLAQGLRPSAYGLRPSAYGLRPSASCLAKILGHINTTYLASNFFIALKWFPRARYPTSTDLIYECQKCEILRPFSQILNSGKCAKLIFKNTPWIWARYNQYCEN